MYIVQLHTNIGIITSVVKYGSQNRVLQVIGLAVVLLNYCLLLLIYIYVCIYFQNVPTLSFYSFHYGIHYSALLKLHILCRIILVTYLGPSAVIRNFHEIFRSHLLIMKTKFLVGRG